MSDSEHNDDISGDDGKKSIAAGEFSEYIRSISGDADEWTGMALRPTEAEMQITQGSNMFDLVKTINSRLASVIADIEAIKADIKEIKGTGVGGHYGQR